MLKSDDKQNVEHGNVFGKWFFTQELEALAVENIGTTLKTRFHWIDPHFSSIALDAGEIDFQPLTVENIWGPEY